MKSSTPLGRKRRILFVGLYHTANDYRLCGFLAGAIRERWSDVECLYLGRDSIDPKRYSNSTMTVIEMPKGMNPKKRLIRSYDLEQLANHIVSRQIDLVQISDVGELTLGYLIKKTSDIPVIYDAHEDYFNQKYEYSKKSPIGLYNGAIARLREILHVRRLDAVFCTDAYLEALYRSPLFGVKSVKMVRNIPARDMIRSEPIFHARDALKLIYIGSVNRIRGIIETAEYCKRFNEEPEIERQGVSLSFHVYAKPGMIVETLVSAGLIEYHGYLSEKALAEAMSDFDIGVSLIQPCKKYERNILIKNFEYMAMGLPVLTSNFGTMKQYVGESGAGVPIDPTSYREFKRAILQLKDRSFRKTAGLRGIAYAEAHFHRGKEVAPYLEKIGELLRLP